MLRRSLSRLEPPTPRIHAGLSALLRLARRVALLHYANAGQRSTRLPFEVALTFAMKVWIVDQNANLMYYAYSLALGLVQNGCEVSIVTCKDYEWTGPPSQRIQVVEAFFRWSTPLIKRFGLLRKARSLRMALKAIEYPFGYLFLLNRYRHEKPDIIHFQYANIPAIERLVFGILRRYRIPFLLTVHNIVQPRPGPLDNALFGPLYRRMPHLVVHSNDNKNALQTLFGVAADRIHVIAHGNYNAYLPTTMPDQGAARDAIGVPRDSKIVLFFGIIFEFKGLDVLIRALAQVDREIKPFLVIAGQPSQGFEKYAAEIQRLNLEQCVLTRLEFISYEELTLLFSAADVVALPYKRISQSGVMFVAFSFGRPVVATRVGSFPETVVEGQNGYLVEPESDSELGAALNRILRDEAELRRMSMTAKRISDERYDWSEIAATTLKVYEEAREAAK